MHNICSSDTLWRRLYVKYARFVTIPPEICAVADEVGWKRAFLVQRLKLNAHAVKTTRKVRIKEHEEHFNDKIEERKNEKTVKLAM